MSKLVTWRALQPCVVGGAYREAGEVFEAPDGDYAPDVREKVGARNAAPEVTPAGEEKPLDQMNANELNAKAKELGLTFPSGMKANKDKAAYIAAELEAAAAPGVTPTELPNDDV